MLALHEKDLILVGRLPEALQELGFKFLVFYIQGIACKIELPHFLDFKVLGDVLPVDIDLFYQLQIRFNNFAHCAQIH